jgi:hypothetical protein
MESIRIYLTLPAELEVWLIFGYVVTVLLAARVIEALARVHFTRARRSAEHGFEYVPEEDHYRCPEGQRLSLHLHDAERRLAVYRAPASTCNECPMKAACTPHDEGRHLYRPLVEWAETDVAYFHRRVSLLMFSAGAVISMISFLRWGGQPGCGLLLLAFAIGLCCALQSARSAQCLKRRMDRVIATQEPRLPPLQRRKVEP